MTTLVVRSCGAVAAIIVGLLSVTALSATMALAGGVVGTGTAASCTDGALDHALTGGGTVTFNCGGPATIDISTGTGTKTIGANTTIDGGGLITISGGDSVGVFRVNSGITFTVNNLTIANGFAFGGGIENYGTTTVINCTLSGNRGRSPFSECSFCGAGGILYGTGQNPGTTTVTNSTFTGNSGAAGGGIGSEGLAQLQGASLLTVTNSTFTGNIGAIGGGIGISSSKATTTVTNSTFTGNNAVGGGVGGGIGGFGASLTVTNSTFTGNSSGPPLLGVSGGGIGQLGGSLTVTNSTFIGNSGFSGPNGGDAPSGGGIAVGIDVTPPPLLRNTLLANNTPGDNCYGVVTDGGHNLDDGTSCGFSTANGSLSSTDPQFDPAGLQDNGGPTQTIALLGGSPAINAGDESICSAPPVNNLDQRGYVRPGTGAANCSIGAYEADVTAAEVCVGDCNGDHSVTVDELVSLVNIALGNPGLCLSGVPTGATVDVSLIITAVNHALSVCG